MKVVVAMSGGVDSSVTAALLADQGHEVVGVHIDPSFINSEGKVQITEMKPIARCGGLGDYAVVEDLFQMERPK